MKCRVAFLLAVSALSGGAALLWSAAAVKAQQPLVCLASTVEGNSGDPGITEQPAPNSGGEDAIVTITDFIEYNCGDGQHVKCFACIAGDLSGSASESGPWGADEAGSSYASQTTPCLSTGNQFSASWSFLVSGSINGGPAYLEFSLSAAPGQGNGSCGGYQITGSTTFQSPVGPN